MLSSAEIGILMEGIERQYSLGPALKLAMKEIVDQAIEANALREQNTALIRDNDRLQGEVYRLRKG